MKAGGSAELSGENRDAQKGERGKAPAEASGEALAETEPGILLRN